MGATGATGPQGVGIQGPQGDAGTNSLISITPIPADSTQCPAGGEEIEVGQDLNGNKILDGDEVTNTAHVCNGTSASPEGDAGSSDGGPDSSLDAAGTEDTNPAVDSGVPTSDAATGPVLLTLACGSATITGSSFDGTAWTLGFPAGTYNCDGVALAVTSTGQGVGLLAGGAAFPQYTTWTNGSWTAPTQLESSISSTGMPTITATAKGAEASFQGSSFSLYYAEFSGGNWSPTTEAVGSPQAFSPVPGAIASIGGNATLAFIDGNSGNQISTSDRIGGAWGPFNELPQGGPNTPAIVALASGPELMVAEALGSAGIIYFTRTNGMWSDPASVPNTESVAGQFALLALPNEGALLVFAGADGNLYTATYSNGTWSTPSPLSFGIPVSGGGPAVSLAPGVFGDIAELAFLEDRFRAGPALGGVFHARYSTTGWSSATQIGHEGGNRGVSIASRQ